MTAPSNHVTVAEARAAAEAAARASLRAPSVFNTQPWKWRITGDAMELSSDPARRLGVTDAEGRLLLLSCGGALHHARVALAANGWAAVVQRLPDERRPDLLARIRIIGRRSGGPGGRRRWPLPSAGGIPTAGPSASGRVTDATLTRLRRTGRGTGRVPACGPGRPGAELAGPSRGGRRGVLRPGVPDRADPLDQPARLDRRRGSAGHRGRARSAPGAGAQLPPGGSPEVCRPATITTRARCT